MFQTQWPSSRRLFLNIKLMHSIRYRCCATNRKVAGSIPAGVSGFFIDIKSFRSHYGSGVDSASNRNEYQEHFLGVKSSRCIRLSTYHHPVLLSRNLGTLTSWNPLSPSGPVTALLYLYSILYSCFHIPCGLTCAPFCLSKICITIYNIIILLKLLW